MLKPNRKGVRKRRIILLTHKLTKRTYKGTNREREHMNKQKKKTKNRQSIINQTMNRVEPPPNKHTTDFIRLI